jgi:hypothetical protein
MGFTIGNGFQVPTETPPYNSAANAGTHYANGAMADAAFYDVALSAERVAAHYAARNN